MAHQLTNKTIASTYEQLIYRSTTQPSTGTTTTQLMTSENDQTDDVGLPLYISTERVGIGTATPTRTLQVETNTDNEYVAWFENTHTTGNGVLVRGASGTSRNSFVVQPDGGATSYFIVRGDGNVGIGTASPGSLLDVRGTNTATQPHLRLVDTASDSDPTMEFWADGGDDSNDGYRISGAATAGGLKFETSKTADLAGSYAFDTAMTVGYGANNYVGIGTASPGQDLAVENNQDAATAISVTNPSTGASADCRYSWYNSANNINAIFYSTGHSLANKLIFTDSATSDICFDISGKVGIGTAAPYKPLDVSSTSGIAISNTDFNNSNTGTRILIETGATSGNTYGEIHVQDEGGGSNNNLALLPNGGNVGIGTTTPDTLLEISGAGAVVTSTITCYSDDGAHFPALYLRKADGTEADPDLVANDDVLGVIYFQGLDADSGGSYMPGAAIIARVDGTPTDDQMPCELEFWTNTGDSSGTKNAYLAEGGDWYTNDGTVSSIASDERLKKDIRDFTHGLSVVNQLNPVYYKFNGENGRNVDTEDRIGMLANVVKDIAPDITEIKMGKLDGVDTELYTMSYDKLIFYVVNAIQELSASVDILSTKVEALENA